MGSCLDNTDISYYVSDHCPTGEIVGYLSVATKNNNAVFMEYLLRQLIDRGEMKIFVEELVKIVGKEITIGSGFYSVVRDVLAMNRERLRLEPVLSNFENCQRFPMKVEDLLKGTKFAECERFASQDGEAKHDGRLDEFLKSLSNKGTVSATMGYKIIKDGTDTRRNSIPETESDQCNFKIVDGVLQEKDARRILSYLDIMGIKEALPTFCGDWETFVLKDGTWEPYTGGEKCNKMFFFTCDSYSSVNQ